MGINLENCAKILLFSVIIATCSVSYVEANAPTLPNKTNLADTLSAFRQLKNIGPVSVVVPTVVEFPIEVTDAERKNYAVYDVITSEFVPFILREKSTTNPVVVRVSSGTSEDYKLVDNNSMTSVDYDLQTEGVNSVTIELSSDTLIESSSVYLELDRYVSLPRTVSVRARVDGVSDKVILAETPLRSTSITFPSVKADNWAVTFTYAQPLRINEIRLVQDSVTRDTKRSVRFLAQPGSAYLFYHDADRNVVIQTKESGNLFDDTGVLQLKPVTSMRNQAYIESDVDGDGIVDTHDNCVRESNSDQADLDGNGKGDVCDDYDRDGIIQSKDNCPLIPNMRQEDVDGDGVGDVCDDEESRVTEKYPWIPWAGMGVAGLVLVVLFVLVAMTPKKESKEV